MKLLFIKKWIIFCFTIHFISLHSQKNCPIELLLDFFSSYSHQNIIENKNIDYFFEKKYGNEVDFIVNSEKIFNHSQEEKEWTILIYIAGVNDLFKYALRNIRQMMQIGSSSKLNIIIHFDFHIKGMPKMTKRFYVEKDKIKQVGDMSALDSGDAKNLINSVQWTHSNYPSKYFGLVLWNHGTGSCDPHFMRKLANPKDFFYYNHKTKKIALDRSKEFLEYIKNDDMGNDAAKGICFDDTTRNYLDNKKLAYALEKISDILKKKINIILLDACLMGGVEIADLCSQYAEYLVFSEEVVLGPGYNYAFTLKPLHKENCLPYDFAVQAVKWYAQTYSPITHDFTQSAINLSLMNEFRAEFKNFVEIIMHYLSIDTRDHLKKAIKLAASREMVTHFSEPSYIDLRHFLDNLMYYIFQNPKKINFSKKELDFIKNLKSVIEQKLIPLLNKIVVANATGDNVSKAHGLYIYFPKYQIEEGYKNTSFPMATKWLQLLHMLKK
jgi:hypothetical protein